MATTGVVAVTVALLVALVKGSLVACYFMHLISEKKLIYAVLALTAVCLGLYLYLGRLSSSPLQTGNESMYAVPPIYMLQSGDFLVPRFEGEIFLDKPPLAHWFIAASYGLFGITVASERLPGAVASLATVLAVYLWVRRRSGERAADLRIICRGLQIQIEAVLPGLAHYRTALNL